MYAIWDPNFNFEGSGCTELPEATPAIVSVPPTAPLIGSTEVVFPGEGQSVDARVDSSGNHQEDKESATL